MKYNDINISESSWEELERDSFGGMTNASAYCLMYIDDRLPDLITGLSGDASDLSFTYVPFYYFCICWCVFVSWMWFMPVLASLRCPDDTDDETGQVLHGLDSLPSVLRRYVSEDNCWFQQELSEWEEQICQTASPQGESTSSAEPPDPSPEHLPQTVGEPAPQSGPPSEEPDQRAPSEPQPEPEPEVGDGVDHGEKEEGLFRNVVSFAENANVPAVATTITMHP